MKVLSEPTGESQPASWAYPKTDETRDLRLDFMRGFVIPLLLISHFEYFSLYMYIGWERVGVVSTAEIFVILAGAVVGLVYGKKLTRDGFSACLPPLFKRSWQLYRVNVLVILVIGLLRYLPQINTTPVVSFHDPYRDIYYPLYPPLDAGWFKLLTDALLLRCGPHQFQIVGLYVVLFALITPAVLFMLSKKQTVLLLTMSWGVYLFNWFTPESQTATAEIRLTGAQFEYAFPLIVWQLLYVHGIVAGFYKKQVLEFFQTGLGKLLLYVSIFLSLLFIIFTLNHPMEQFVSWMKFSFIPTDTFNELYFNYFQKYKLGPGRLLNIVVLFISIYAMLTRFWYPFNRALGWFLIPLGQASLYVFFIHVFILILVGNTPFPAYNNFWINSGIHTFVFALVWLMVKKEFLFRWIPK